jgi:hypothetical protein
MENPDFRIQIHFNHLIVIMTGGNPVFFPKLTDQILNGFGSEAVRSKKLSYTEFNGLQNGRLAMRRV